MMTFLAPFLIWLAKLLIQYFLNSNIQIKRQLDEAVYRNQELKASTEEIEKINERYKGTLAFKETAVISLRKKIQDINFEIDEQEKIYNERKKKIEEHILKLDDDTILQSDI